MASSQVEVKSSQPEVKLNKGKCMWPKLSIYIISKNISTKKTTTKQLAIKDELFNTDIFMLTSDLTEIIKSNKKRIESMSTSDIADNVIENSIIVQLCSDSMVYCNIALRVLDDSIQVKGFHVYSYERHGFSIKTSFAAIGGIKADGLLFHNLMTNLLNVNATDEKKIVRIITNYTVN